MVICFEEKDRTKIEATGISIIEFKKELYKTSKTVSDAWSVLEDAVRKLAKAWSAFVDGFLEAVDKAKMVIEIVKDFYHYPTSFRYKAVKFMSKCSGIEMWKLWKMTRHTWLARSCC